MEKLPAVRFLRCLCLGVPSLALLMSCSSIDTAPAPSVPPPVVAPAKDIVPRPPANPRASARTGALLRDLTALSIDGARAACGQNVYHGSQIVAGYPRLMGALETSQRELPAILGVDYEHDAIFTPAQLGSCNRVLMDFAARGGIITINWSPQSPWANDESDIAGNPGNFENTRVHPADKAAIRLGRLLDPACPEYTIWRRKLDRVAGALKELQAAGVTVLWRPMQEMNGFWFWWGCSSQPGAATEYIALWRDMFRYFSQEKGLDNLLWVYSPAACFSTVQMRQVSWAYPGDDYVDIVAGTAYNDRLEIADYAEYCSLGKPLGMAEYGSDSWGPLSRQGSLDNRLYIEKLKSAYPRIAYWVAWHDWDWGDGSSAHQSLAANRNTAGLFADPRTLTLGRWKARP